MSHSKATGRIDALILSVGDRTGHELTKSDATLILRDLDTHARGLRMAGKSATHILVDEFEAAKYGLTTMRMKLTEQAMIDKLCPFHGNAYKSGECAVCQSIVGLSE